MIKEKDMENAIAQNPKKYLGEDGLQLIERQFRIGNYIFDLLFKDRHGAKLIVEIQKGTLDREHTYKILDYYDGFKEKNPKEFIELMVLANKIPEERKKRLRSWGVEYREIPEEEFILDGSSLGSNPAPTPPQPIAKNERSDAVYDDSSMESYQLFKEQKNRFVEELARIDKEVVFKMNWKELNNKNINTRTNWFIVFTPKKWGVWKGGGFGVHFGFIYDRDKKTKIEYVRLPVGVEKPLKSEFQKQFKLDVVKTLNLQGVKLPGCNIWPNVGYGGAKLIEPTRVVIDNHTWENVLKNYLALGTFIQVVSDEIKRFYNNGCFNVRLDFPA